MYRLLSPPAVSCLFQLSKQSMIKKPQVGQFHLIVSIQQQQKQFIQLCIFWYFCKEYWGSGKLGWATLRWNTNVYFYKMQKKISWFENYKMALTLTNWAPHACQCSVQLFVLSGNDALTSQNSHSRETSKYQRHSTKSANHNTITLLWHGPFLSLLSKAIACCARCHLDLVDNTKFGLVSGRARTNWKFWPRWLQFFRNEDKKWNNICLFKA